MTSATGSVGREMRVALAEAGHAVRALTRRAQDFEDNVEAVVGDLNGLVG